jgi:tRNA A-37 threonylcarbamoyl transferase component Bud32
MPDSDEPTASAGDPLDAIIAEYVQQVEAGNVPDRESLLAAHPELADRLRAFFADYDRLDRQAAELRLAADSERTTDALGPAGELPRIRYFGDYELLEVIARGGMGVVYKTRQVSLSRLVALKMILRGELATERDVARFQAEAAAAATLDHPHIVPIYEIGEHDGQQYYSMRYVEGTSLARRPRSDVRSEARLLAAVAGAVHHAHRRGVLHRDLKPSNILVDTAGTPLVADFGLAKRVDADRSLTESGAIVGTPRYMAPEQATGRKDLTVAVDVYSLGVVLYERLTGRTPFAGETVLEVLRQAREAEPPRPSSVHPGLDRDLETICLKCLEKDPAKRYDSAEALQDDLERWLRGEPIKARPVSQAERVWRWCRRNPVVASLASAVLLALVLGAAVATIFGVLANEARQEADKRAVAEKEARDQADQDRQTAERRKLEAEASTREAREQLGAAQIQLALNYRREGKAVRARESLQAVPPRGASLGMGLPFSSARGRSVHPVRTHDGRAGRGVQPRRRLPRLRGGRFRQTRGSQTVGWSYRSAPLRSQGPQISSQECGVQPRFRQAGHRRGRVHRSRGGSQSWGSQVVGCPHGTAPLRPRGAQGRGNKRGV